MVDNISDYFYSHGLSGDVAALGASDIEMGFEGPLISRAWTDGYDSVSSVPAYYNCGGAGGCQDFNSGNEDSCGSPAFPGWYSGDVFHVSYGSPSALPTPEIYNTSGTNAEQWVMISVWAHDHSKPILRFQGPLTQQAACAQKGSCGGIDNSPLDAWNQMENKMDAKPVTRMQMSFSMDIKWQNP